MNPKYGNQKKLEPEGSGMSGKDVTLRLRSGCTLSSTPLRQRALERGIKEHRRLVGWVEFAKPNVCESIEFHAETQPTQAI